MSINICFVDMFFADSQKAVQQGGEGLALLNKNRGSLQRLLDLIEPYLNASQD